MPRTLMPAATACALAFALLATGCASPQPDETPDGATAESAEDGHGAVAGAAQVAEPQNQLVFVGASGEVSFLDLLTDETTALDSVGAPEAIASDGRYAFVTTADGVDVVDGGRWSWDHGDHFHYYRADPAITGSVEGAGPVGVTGAPLATTGGTGLFFAGSGESVLLDNEALAAGEVSELFRIDTGASSGVVAPIDAGAIVATDEGAAVLDASGTEIEPIDCASPAGAITTRVGTVVGCEHGAIIVSGRLDDLTTESVPYPDDAGPRALSFSGRKNRPTIAGLSGDRGFWLLDTRSGSWSHAEVDAAIVDVVAADDDGGHVVALGADGRVRVFDEAGEPLGETEPLVADSLAAGEETSLVVDTQRAYLSAPSEGVVYEIDYADGARVARELAAPGAGSLATELGR